MMKAIWKPTLFFVFCLAIFLIINLPVGLILKHASLPTAVKLYGVKGQVTSGHITEVYVNNFSFRDINYKADLSCLLTLHVCYQINYQNGKANILFNPLTNNTAIEQLDVDYSMAELAPLMGQLLVKPTGELNLKFNQINLKQNKVSNINGLVIWSNAGVVGEGTNLGDYQLQVAREDNSYRFKLIDLKAVLGIAGTGRLKSDGEYLLDIKVKVASDMDGGIKSLLSLAAKKKGINEYVIYKQGQLLPHLSRQLLFSDDL